MDQHLDPASVSTYFASSGEAATMGNVAPSWGNVRYRSYVVQREGLGVVVDVLKEGYEGEIERFYVAKEGVSVQRGTPRISPIEPLLATVASIHVAPRSLHVAEALLAAPQAYRVRVRLYEGAAPERVLVEGPVLESPRSRSLNRWASSVEVAAACGLGPLATVPLVETLLQAEDMLADGTQTLIWWLRRALASTGLPLVACVRTWARGMAATADPLAQVQAPPSRWVRVVDEADALPRAESSSAADVLAHIATAFGACLVQRFGVWLLVERRLLVEDTASIEGWAYPAGVEGTAEAVVLERASLNVTSRRLKGGQVRVPDLPDRLALTFRHGKSETGVVSSTSSAEWAVDSAASRTTAMIPGAAEGGQTLGAEALRIPVALRGEEGGLPPQRATSPAASLPEGYAVALGFFGYALQTPHAYCVRILAIRDGLPTLYARRSSNAEDPTLEWTTEESHVETETFPADTWTRVDLLTNALPSAAIVWVCIYDALRNEWYLGGTALMAQLRLRAGEPGRLDADSERYEVAREGAAPLRLLESEQSAGLEVSLGSGPLQGYPGALLAEGGAAVRYWMHDEVPAPDAGEPLHLLAGREALLLLRGGRGQEEYTALIRPASLQIADVADVLARLADQEAGGRILPLHVDVEAARGTVRVAGRLARVSEEAVTIIRTDLGAASVNRPPAFRLPPMEDLGWGPYV
ncbi:MAG: hypothetical protein IAE99_08185 [Rhodothermales bacterium]|nr:hypothetical protein [Rhodothermales bacterium]